MKKKVLTFVMVLACVWTTCISVLAAGSADAPDNAPGMDGGSSGGTIISHTLDGVEVAGPGQVSAALKASPRFLYFHTISSSISESNGIAICTGTVLTMPEYQTKLSITLQRCKNGSSSWSNVKTWSDPYTTGEQRIVLEKQYYLTSGYSYRLVSKVSVKAEGHTETADCASNTVYY